MTEEQFWDSNPRRMKPYIEAHKLRIKREDEIAWLHGTYVCEALLSTVCGMFQKKGADPYNYPDRPRMAEAEERKKLDNHELTQEEIIAQTNMLFASLAVMQGNFELSKGEGHNG